MTPFPLAEAELETALRQIDQMVGRGGPQWSDLQPLFDAAEALYPKHNRRRFNAAWVEARHAYLEKYKEYSLKLDPKSAPAQYKEAFVRYKADASGAASDKGKRPFWQSIFRPKGMREAEAELEASLEAVDRFVSGS